MSLQWLRDYWDCLSETVQFSSYRYSKDMEFFFFSIFFSFSLLYGLFTYSTLHPPFSLRHFTCGSCLEGRVYGLCPYIAYPNPTYIIVYISYHHVAHSGLVFPRNIGPSCAHLVPLRCSRYIAPSRVSGRDYNLNIWYTG